MTVDELIKELQKCPGHLEVMVQEAFRTAWTSPVEVLQDCDNIVYIR